MTSDDAVKALYCAIGRVASESANTEQILRVALREYTDFNDAIGVVFGGQSFDWLADSIRAVFRCAFEILLEDSPAYDAAKEKFDAISESLASVRPMRDRRNLVIHGTWSICHGGDECYAKPSVDESNDKRIFHFSRSRIRRHNESEEHLAVLEIEQLADSIKAQNDVLSGILDTIRPQLYF